MLLSTPDTSLQTKQCGMHNSPKSRKSFFCALRSGHKGHCYPYSEVDRQGIVIPPALTETDSQISALNLQLALLKARKNDQQKEVSVVCLGWSVTFRSDGCGAKLPISDLEYIQTHWYTGPTGCSEGDYWNEGEGQFVCPVCGKLNRLCDRPEVVALKTSFKSIKDIHDK